MLKGAVFLSYASQDAAAARRVGDGLRAAGAQVWLDESELAGGDSWDSKIRGQIEGCALFIALISANTNARLEGYFRKEWKLAVERTHAMHDSLTFILPVVIDATAEAEALAPDKFRQVQWTRLPGGEVSAAFRDRVMRLLVGVPDGDGAGWRPPSPQGTGGAAGPERSGLAWRAWTVAAVVSAVAASSLIFFWPKAPTVASGLGPEAPGPVPAPQILEKSIAILPFVNMSEDKGNAYFADGVQEDILTNLALIGDMSVVSRTSVMGYRDTTKSTQQIARELGVAYVLEGSVRREGRKVRVTGQLIDGRTGLHLWAHSYDREMDDIFEIQSTLSKEIADALHLKLTPGDLAQLESRPTDSSEAYDLYLRGTAAMDLLGGTATETTTQGLKYFEQAVAIDPKFVKAWLEIAWIYFSWNSENPSPGFKAKYTDAVETARRLAPNALPVLLRLYYDADRSNDTALAKTYLRRIAEAYPNNGDTLSAQAYDAWGRGDVRSAATLFKRGRALDPRNATILYQVGQFDLAVREFDEASAVFSLVGTRQKLRRWDYFRIALIPYFARGDRSQVEAYVSSFSPNELRTDADSISSAALWAYIKGDAAGLVRLRETSGDHFVMSIFTEHRNLFGVGEALLVLGQPERARPIFEKYRDEAVATLAKDPDSEGALTDLIDVSYRLHENAVARKARERLVRLFPEDEDDIVAKSAIWSGDKADIDAAFVRLGVILRKPSIDAWSYCVHSMAHSIHMWPLQGDPRLDEIVKDPANSAPKL